MKLSIKNLFYISCLMALKAHLAFAQTPSADRLKAIAGEAKYSNVTGGPKAIAINIILYALGFVAVIFVGLVIYSGFEWIRAGGNEEIVGKAKTRLKNAIIGLFVITAAYAITSWAFNAALTVTPK